MCLAASSVGVYRTSLLQALQAGAGYVLVTTCTRKAHLFDHNHWTSLATRSCWIQLHTSCVLQLRCIADGLLVQDSLCLYILAKLLQYLLAAPIQREGWWLLVGSGEEYHPAGPRLMHNASSAYQPGPVVHSV